MTLDVKSISLNDKRQIVIDLYVWAWEHIE